MGIFVNRGNGSTQSACRYDKSCNSRTIFESLKIAGANSFEEHLNQYDVIHLDIAYLLVQVKDSLETVSWIQKCVIEELKELYPGILSDEDRMLPFSLSKIHHGTGARFIIIIDEWDAMFREDKDDEAAQQAYITGILPIKKYKSESALNNFDEFTMTNPGRLAEYVGFTEQEVKNLCETYHMDFSETARWYDGYSFRRMKHVYNPNPDKPEL